MIYNITIPPAGESIASAAIARWYKRTGEWVTEGDLLVSLETDKVSNDLLASNSGVLTIIVHEGEEVGIGTLIGTLNDEASLVSAAGAVEKEKPLVEAVSAPVVEEKNAPEVKPVPAPAHTPLSPFAKPLPAPPPNAISSLAEAARMIKAPLEKTAAEPAVSPVSVSVVAPVALVSPVSESTVVSTPVSVPEVSPVVTLAEAVVQDAPASVQQVATLMENRSREYGLSADGRTERVRMSPLRRKVSAQLVNVQNEAAILTTFNECDMSAVMELRKTLQKDFVDRHGVKLGFMSFFLKAVVHALKCVPELNAQVDGNDIVMKHFYDISVAVGTDRGLVVPVVRDCDKKSFADLERELAGLADKARKGQISLEDLQGGVFTISNGGVYGSLLSTPIINPPQSGILGLHAIKDRPIAEDGQVVIRPMMYLALSYDHRLVDGKQAVTFLLRIKDCIENPTRLLLEA